MNHVAAAYNSQVTVKAAGSAVRAAGNLYSWDATGTCANQKLVSDYGFGELGADCGAVS
ncbi:hypothetical protein [Streptomyces sp. KR80]|uniref:hypothetical protein n=1 Tax=Streptomyces sp. KR80 TaxID=3457426 RepID=UPI003FCF8071